MSTVSKNTSGKRMAQLVATREQLFHVSDLALLFGIANANTLRVTLNRYAREGMLFRIRRGLYSLVPSEQIDPVRLAAASLHQYCYLSTETVLWESGILLQTPQALTFVSADARRFSISGHRIVSRQLQDRFLHHPAGVIAKDGVRRATTERAVCDLLYFQPTYHFDHPIDWAAIRTLQEEIGYSLTSSCRIASCTSSVPVCYTVPMSQEEIITHWRKGAQDSMEVARMCYVAQKYEQAFFHCHLAIEKALKALYMQEHSKDHPYTHDLFYLANLVKHSLDEKDVVLLKELSAFVTDARYSDPYWAREQATEENTQYWVEVTERIIPRLLS